MSETSTPAADAPQVNVVIERTYRARIEDLWELWTTKAGFERWWGPEGFRVEVHALDARAGGTLAYDMIADAPEAIAAMKRMGQPLSHHTRGRFTEFKPLAIQLPNKPEPVCRLKSRAGKPPRVVAAQQRHDPPISRASPKRFIGVRATSQSFTWGSLRMAALLKSVTMPPGATVLARILRISHSFAK